MDLSKAFGCIPHDLLIAKLHAYGFSEISFTFFHSYLKQYKQNVKINNTHSLFLYTFLDFCSSQKQTLIFHHFLK